MLATPDSTVVDHDRPVFARRRFIPALSARTCATTWVNPMVGATCSMRRRSAAPTPVP